MMILRILLLSLVALCLLFSFAFAEGDAAKGKVLFNDSKAFGGTKSCSSCHPDGKGLEKASSKKDLRTPLGPAKSLEEAINTCIVNANKGKALDPKSAQMKDMVAYIKSLGKKMEKEAPAKPKTGGY